MNEPCVCGGSGVNGGEPCHWCSAGTIPRAILRVVMDPNVGYLTSETQNLVSEAYSVIRADHKDTTEPQRKFVKQKCERCNMYALPGSNRCKYHTDPMSPTENIVTT